jgi:3-dehydroquinate synthase class II
MADTSEQLIAEATQASQALQALSRLNRGPDVLVVTVDDFQKLKHRIGARTDTQRSRGMLAWVLQNAQR